MVGVKSENVGEVAGSLNVRCGDWYCGSAGCLAADDWVEPSPSIVLEVEMACGDSRCIVLAGS